jgi:hypothetical protein
MKKEFIMATATARLSTTNLFKNSAPASNEPTTERKQSKVWLNIGFKHTYMDDDGNEQETFISTPVGLPIDTMTARKVSGNNANFREIVKAGNSLLESLQQLGMSLDGGEARVVEGLQIQIQRVREEDDAVEGETSISMPTIGFK